MCTGPVISHLVVAIAAAAHELALERVPLVPGDVKIKHNVFLLSQCYIFSLELQALIHSFSFKVQVLQFQ